MKSNRRVRPSHSHWPSPKPFTVKSGKHDGRPIKLWLPLDVPSALFDLSDVDHSLKACRVHFGELELDWKYERKGSFGRARSHAVLRFDPTTGDIWTLVVLEAATAGKHIHNRGESYGEFIVTLAGELDDVLDCGGAVTLKAGMVMFHAPETVHEARATRFWVGLIHQPHGCTEIA